MNSDGTILITGGAGFIGTSVCARLADTHKIRVLDVFRRDALTAAGLHTHPNIEVIRGDVCDAPLVKDAMDGCDYVLHMASIAGVDTVIKNPVPTMEIALEGTMNVLRAAKGRTGLKRLIDFSTSEVFGTYAFRAREQDVTSLGAVGEARWTYAVSKLATEHLCHNYYKQFDVPCCAIRPFNIYGPGQVGEGAIHAFVVRALKGEAISIHNQGDQIRAWCYIDDIVDGIELALSKEAAVGESFNIGNPRSTVTIYHLARMVVNLAKSDSDLNFVEWDFPDVALRVPDIKKAEGLLGFSPKVDLEAGLLKTIEWYRSQMQASESSS